MFNVKSRVLSVAEVIVQSLQGVLLEGRLDVCAKSTFIFSLLTI